jgi:NDP-sugar pyrophosphorylase family protein
MKAVILAGGKGTRLRPLTFEKPKPLLFVRGRPILEHVINYLKGHGITDLIITIEYMGDKIRKYFGDGKRFGVNIQYSEEKKPLGTAGCLTLIKDKLNETFILMGGDNLTKLDLRKFIRFHKKKKGILTVALFEYKEKSKWGIYTLNRDKSIQNFLEKPVFKHTAGTMIFCLEPKIFEYIPKNPKGVVNITDHTIPYLLKRGEKIFGFPFKDFWVDIGSLDDYKKLTGGGFEI